MAASIKYSHIHQTITTQTFPLSDCYILNTLTVFCGFFFFFVVLYVSFGDQRFSNDKRESYQGLFPDICPNSGIHNLYSQTSFWTG